MRNVFLYELITSGASIIWLIEVKTFEKIQDMDDIWIDTASDSIN